MRTNKHHYLHSALPRPCCPQVTRIGTHSALHSRSAIPWRFNRSLTSSGYFRLPSTGLAIALDLECLNLWGMILRCCGVAGPWYLALHSRFAIPWRFNRSLTSFRYFRLPSTGLARTLDLVNSKLLGYDFAMLLGYRIVIPCASFSMRHSLSI